MAHEGFQECIDACNECASVCEHCASSCLEERDVARMTECIRLDRDCADACRLAAALMARGSRFAQDLCRMCAMICDACATECEKHDMDHCRDCAKACRACADECRRMAERSRGTGAGQAVHA